MAKADVAKSQKGKNWTTEAFEEFALVLIDEENCSAVSLEIVIL